MSVMEDKSTFLAIIGFNTSHVHFRCVFSVFFMVRVVAVGKLAECGFKASGVVLAAVCCKVWVLPRARLHIWS